MGSGAQALWAKGHAPGKGNSLTKPGRSQLRTHAPIRRPLHLLPRNGLHAASACRPLPRCHPPQLPRPRPPRPAHVVQQDLLHDEGGHRLGQLRADLHGAQAQRDDLRGQEEVDHVRVVNLDSEGAEWRGRGAGTGRAP